MKKIFKIYFLLLFLFFSCCPSVYGLMYPVLEVNNFPTKKEPILAGEILQQSFISPEDEFGAIGIKVDNNNRLNDDFWIFRIKKEGEGEWYFETKKYITDFQSGVFYPIGFPKITDAKGKKFIFEIKSEKGREDNCASVFLTSEDNYPQGEALLNGEKIKGDLVFSVYKETPAEKLIFQDFLKKFNQDKSFFLFWIGIILVLIIILLSHFLYSK